MAGISITDSSNVLKTLKDCKVTDANNVLKDVKEIWVTDASNVQKKVWSKSATSLSIRISNLLFNLGSTGDIVSGMFFIRLVLEDSVGRRAYIYIPTGNLEKRVPFNLSTIPVGYDSEYVINLDTSALKDIFGTSNIYVRALEVAVAVWSNPVSIIGIECNVNSSVRERENIDLSRLNTYQLLSFPTGVVELILDRQLSVDLIFEEEYI